MFRLNRNDIKLLSLIASHRLLTLDQVAMAHGGHRDAVSKRLCSLEERAYLTSRSGCSRGPGRPEKLVSLTEGGLQLLKDKRVLAVTVSAGETLAPKDGSLDHLLLTNWVLVHLAAMCRRVPIIDSAFLSYATAAEKPGDQSAWLIREQVQLPESPKLTRFAPDIVFRLTHSELSKSLLFFVEVDRGSEALSNRNRAPGDLRHKIRCYQEYFTSDGYKRYEALWNTSFNGFRLLFLAHSQNRLAAICRIVREMPPSDFIWATDFARLRSTGLHGKIWSRGGSEQNTSNSILGSQFSAAERLTAQTRSDA